MEGERFYFDGIFYDSKTEWEHACVKFSNSDISPMSVERILAGLCREISMNLFVRCNENQKKMLSNSEFQQICMNSLCDFMKHVEKKLGS